MKRAFVCAALGAVLTAVAVRADVLAYTSFEEPATGSMYYDTGDPSMDHFLVNNPGQMSVVYESTGNELGFNAVYMNTRGGVGLTDGDWFGVTAYTGTVGAFPDGSQGYEMTDADGRVTTFFNYVELPEDAVVTVSVDVFIIDDGYEDEDYISIGVDVDDGSEWVSLFSAAGDELEGYGYWMTLTATLPDWASVASFMVTIDTNGSYEGLYLDNLVFTPEPTGLVLLALGALVVLRRR